METRQITIQLILLLVSWVPTFCFLILGSTRPDLRFVPLSLARLSVACYLGLSFYFGGGIFSYGSQITGLIYLLSATYARTIIPEIVLAPTVFLFSVLNLVFLSSPFSPNPIFATAGIFVCAIIYIGTKLSMTSLLTSHSRRLIMAHPPNKKSLSPTLGALN